jgi:hypothetical protein
MNINSGPSHRALPPAPPTNIEGDVPLLEDMADDIVEAPAPTPEAKTETPQPEAKDEGFELPPDITESLTEASKLKAPEKPEEKVEEKPLEKPTEKLEEPTKPAEVSGRDYTGLEPEVVAVLKQLRNGAYNAVKDQIPQWFKAYKEKDAMPKYIAQHPEAYKLDKGYQELEVGVNNAGFEASALYESLMSLKQNKPFDLLTGYDDKGKPTYAKIDPTKGVDPRLEFEITEAYRRASQTKQDLTNQHTNYATRYQAKIQQERAFIEDNFKKIFKDIDPTKFTPDEAKYAPLLEQLIPDSVTAADARRIAHYAMIGNLRMGRTLQEYIKANKGKALPPKPQAGPTGAPIGGDIPLDEDKMFEN